MNVQAKNLLQEAQDLTPDDRKELAEALGAPKGKTRDAIWLIVVGAFTVVLLVSFGALAKAMFNEPPKEAWVKPELILSVFTAATGFLAGLFAPSPVGKKGE